MLNTLFWGYQCMCLKLRCMCLNLRQLFEEKWWWQERICEALLVCLLLWKTGCMNSVRLWARPGAKSSGLFLRITPWCQLSVYKRQLWARAVLLYYFVDLAFNPAQECSLSRKNKSHVFLPESVFWLTNWHPDSFVMGQGCRFEEGLLKKLYYLKADLCNEIFQHYSAFLQNFSLSQVSNGVSWKCFQYFRGDGTGNIC